MVSYFQICQETAARDGLMKMKQVYEGNPALGDPMSIQGQLTENEKRLTTLQSEKKKFQVSLLQLGLGVRSRKVEVESSHGPDCDFDFYSSRLLTKSLLQQIVSARFEINSLSPNSIDECV